jgi:hypothetical protein
MAENQATAMVLLKRLHRHFFCSRGGVYTFHRKRAAPDHSGINGFYLEDFDPGSVPVRDRGHRDVRG